MVVFNKGTKNKPIIKKNIVELNWKNTKNQRTNKIIKKTDNVNSIKTIRLTGGFFLILYWKVAGKNKKVDCNVVNFSSLDILCIVNH